MFGTFRSTGDRHFIDGGHVASDETGDPAFIRCCAEVVRSSPVPLPS